MLCEVAECMFVSSSLNNDSKRINVTELLSLIA